VNFVFIKQEHTSKTNVWYDGIYLGEIFVVMKERKDIDWTKYRADKTLRMSPQERFDVKYIASIKLGGTLPRVLSSCESKEKAAQAMLEFHRSQCVDR